MCVVIHQTLIRESADSRLPDVAGPTMVLGAWVTARSIDAARRQWLHVVAVVVAIVVWGTTVSGAALYGELADRIIASGLLAGPTPTRNRIRDVNRLLTGRPIESYAPVGSTGVRALTRYVLECTRPSDRVLTGVFEPQIAFYAERGFAGGQVYLQEGWYASDADQLLTIERLKRQRVPIVILSAQEEPQVQRAFSRVYQYVIENYQEAARSDFGGRRVYAVFTSRHIQPRSTHAALGLPCYR
jgi:hypothetical protein